MGESMGYKADIDILSLLVWTYQAQKADLVIDRGIGLHELERRADGLEVYGVSACGCVAVSRAADLGASIRGSMQCAQLHPDAELVHETLMALKKSRWLSPYQVGLVIYHARTASTPDCMPCAQPRIVPKRNGRGQLMMVYDDNRHPVACRIQVEVSVEEIEWVRDTYRIWHKAISFLEQELVRKNALTSYQLSLGEVDAEPWLRLI